VESARRRADVTAFLDEMIAQGLVTAAAPEARQV
jgi:hypothetical protein